MLGQGAFGAVYLAWDPQLAREVAVKLLRRPSVVESAVMEEGRPRRGRGLEGAVFRPSHTLGDLPDGTKVIRKVRDAADHPSQFQIVHLTRRGERQPGMRLAYPDAARGSPHVQQRGATRPPYPPRPPLRSARRGGA